MRAIEFLNRMKRMSGRVKNISGKNAMRENNKQFIFGWREKSDTVYRLESDGRKAEILACINILHC